MPKGWTEDELRAIAEYYDNQTEDEALAEDEAAYADPNSSVIVVPTELLPEINRLLAAYNDRNRRAESKRRKRRAV